MDDFFRWNVHEAEANQDVYIQRAMIRDRAYIDRAYRPDEKELDKLKDTLSPNAIDLLDAIGKASRTTVYHSPEKYLSVGKFLGKGSYGKVYTVDIEKIKDMSVLKKSSAMNPSRLEYFNGMYGVNRLREYIPNFIYTFAYFECKDMYDNKVCQGRQGREITLDDYDELNENDQQAWEAGLLTHFVDEDPNVAYLLIEKVEGETLQKFIENGAKDEDILNIYVQVLLALQAGQDHPVQFVHGDLRHTNVMVKDLGREAVIQYPLGDTIYTVKTRYLAVIIDYGLSHVTSYKTDTKGVTHEVQIGAVHLPDYKVFPALVPGFDAVTLYYTMEFDSPGFVEKYYLKDYFNYYTENEIQKLINEHKMNSNVHTQERLIQNAAFIPSTTHIIRYFHPEALVNRIILKWRPGFITKRTRTIPMCNNPKFFFPFGIVADIPEEICKFQGSQRAVIQSYRYSKNFLEQDEKEKRLSFTNDIKTFQKYKKLNIDGFFPLIPRPNDRIDFNPDKDQIKNFINVYAFCYAMKQYKMFSYYIMAISKGESFDLQSFFGSPQNLCYIFNYRLAFLYKTRLINILTLYRLNGLQPNPLYVDAVRTVSNLPDLFS